MTDPRRALKCQDCAKVVPKRVVHVDDGKRLLLCEECSEERAPWKLRAVFPR